MNKLELDQQVAKEIMHWREPNLAEFLNHFAGTSSPTENKDEYWCIPTDDECRAKTVFEKDIFEPSKDYSDFFNHVVPAMRHIGIYFVWEEVYNRAKFMLHGDKLIGEHMEGFTKLPRAGCLAALKAIRSMKGAESG